MTRKLKIISLTTLSFWIVAGVAFSQTRDIKFKRISSRFNLSKASISCIHQDSRGFLWFGTFDGLYKYDGYRFTEYKNNPGNPYSLSHNEVRAICEDSSGKLWLATNNGLNRFNPQTESIKRYTEEDGLQSNKFNGTFHKNQQTGEMFLGGVNGFNTFFPYQIKDNTRLPKIVITDFQIFNKSVPVARPYTEQDSNDPSSFKLDKSIAATKELTLSYKERVFSFEFAALHYVNPEKNQYAYKMEGLDEEWNYIGVRRFTTFTNLSPGEYTFRVKGSNSDGVWNEQGTALKIIITPPRWKTWWAYTIYFLLISALIYGIKQFELSRARLKQELKLQHLHTEKLAEIDQMKSRFFANISHEFRTPLTLILGPLEKLLLDDFVEPVKKQFRVMHRNGKRLLRLINQLLDLSKLEAGGMSLQARPENIIKLLKGVVLAFSSLAERKQIDLRFQPPEDFESSQGSDSLTVYLDRDKFEKIISNLLSNAFKFTPAGGENSIKVLVADDIPLDPPRGGNQRGRLPRLGIFTRMFLRSWSLKKSWMMFHHNLPKVPNLREVQAYRRLFSSLKTTPMCVLTSATI